jgi:hypothetical protein
MKWVCFNNGACWFCPNPQRCNELYRRPLDANYAHITRQYDKVARMFESEQGKIDKLAADREKAEAEKKAKDQDPEPKPGFIKALSIWTYWKIMNVIWAIVKAINAARKK